MKGKILSAVIISGIILTAGWIIGWERADQFKIVENVNAIESQQELKMEKIKGYSIIGNFKDEGFIVTQRVSCRDNDPVKEILIKDIKNHKEESIDISSLNIKNIWNIKESNGFLYFTASDNNKSREYVAYEMDIKSKKVRDISRYIKEDEFIYQCDDKKLILLNNEDKIKTFDKSFNEIQNFQLPIQKGENNIYYTNTMRSIKEDGTQITKVYFLREKTHKDGYMGMDTVVSKEAYVYDVNLGIERMLPFKETILSLQERKGHIFIEEKRDNHVYLTKRDEKGRTLNEEYLYNMEKGYTRSAVEISPNGEYAAMNFIRTFKNDKREEVNSIQELYLIDMKNHKKIKLIAVEEGGISGIMWSKSGKSLGFNLRNIAGESEHCIIKIEDIL